MGAGDLGREGLEAMELGVEGFVVANEDVRDEFGYRFLVPTGGALRPGGLFGNDLCQYHVGEQGSVRLGRTFLCACIRECALTPATKVEAMALEHGHRAGVLCDQLGEGTLGPRLRLGGKGGQNRVVGLVHKTSRSVEGKAGSKGRARFR